MRIRLLIIPLIIIFLASCNFPLAQSTNTSGDVATRVAQTLAAAITTPQSDATIIYVTATESVLSPSASSTPTVTPTQADPKLTLGAPAYADTFSSGSAFGLNTPYSDDASEMHVEGGNLVMATTKTYSGIRWRLTYPTPKDFYIEATFKTVQCKGDDFYGLVLRAPDYSDGHGYYFGVTCKGEYYLMKDVSGDDVPLVDWTADSHILTGTNQVNRLGVMAKGNHISLYINGTLVKELDDNSLNAAGHFGVFLASYEQWNMTIQVEEINQWNLP